MTVPYHYESGDHHFPMTATIATFIVVLLAAAGLTVWQSGVESDRTPNTELSTAAVEPFSPEKARISSALETARRGPTVEPFSPEAARLGAALESVRRGPAVEPFSPELARSTSANNSAPAAEQRQALESSLPKAAVTPPGGGHPDIRTPSVTAEGTVTPASGIDPGLVRAMAGRYPDVDQVTGTNEAAVDDYPTFSGLEQVRTENRAPNCEYWEICAE